MTQHDHSHGEQHLGHGGVGKYLTVFGGLCVLTVISFIIGNTESIKENMPQVAWAGMMAVSCAKALLVMLFFMHLLWEANWKYVLTIPASIMSIFLILMLVPDVGRRTDSYAEERAVYVSNEPQSAAHEHGNHHSKPEGDGEKQPQEP